MEDIIIGHTYIPVEKLSGGKIKRKTPIVLPQKLADIITAGSPDYLKKLDEIKSALDYCHIAYLAYDKSTNMLYLMSYVEGTSELEVHWVFTTIDCSNMQIVTYEDDYHPKDISDCGGWSNFKKLLSDYYGKQNAKRKLGKRHSEKENTAS